MQLTAENYRGLKVLRDCGALLCRKGPDTKAKYQILLSGGYVSASIYSPSKVLVRLTDKGRGYIKRIV